MVWALLTSLATATPERPDLLDSNRAGKLGNVEELLSTPEILCPPQESEPGKCWKFKHLRCLVQIIEM
jgi:hypothetical protein